MSDCITFAVPMPWSLLNLCHPRSMFRLTPVAKPFWSRSWSDMLPLLPPPLGGSNWTSNSCGLFLDPRLWLHTVFRHRYFGDSKCEDCGLPSAATPWLV